MSHGGPAAPLEFAGIFGDALLSMEIKRPGDLTRVTSAATLTTRTLGTERCASLGDAGDEARPAMRLESVERSVTTSPRDLADVVSALAALV